MRGLHSQEHAKIYAVNTTPSVLRMADSQHVSAQRWANVPVEISLFVARMVWFTRASVI